MPSTVTNVLKPLAIACALALMPSSRSLAGCQETTYSPTPGQNGQQFGASVALDGAMVAAGSPRYDGVVPGDSSGVVDVYEVGTSFHETRDDNPPESAGDYGWSLSFEGDWLAVGVMNDVGGANGVGSVVVLGRDTPTPDDWGELDTIVGPNPMGNFGFDVQLVGEELVVGEPGADAAHLYEWDGSEFDLVQTISGPSGSGSFGTSVAYDGTTIVVGDPYAVSGGSMTGAAHFYERNGLGVFTLVSTFTGAAAVDGFGIDVAVDGIRAAVGASAEADSSSVRRGAVHAYRRGASTWSQTQVLRACSGSANDYFGFELALEATSLVVAATGADAVATDSGASFYFKDDDEGAWMQVEQLDGDAQAGDTFGYSLDIDGTTVLVGAPRLSISNPGPGKVYRYTCTHVGCSAGADVTLTCALASITRTATTGDAGCGAMTYAWTATSGCGASFSAASSATTDITFSDPCDVNACTITFTVTDQAGGECEDSFSVFPDVTAPVVTACAPNHNLGCQGERPPKQPGQPGYSYGYPTTSDPCATATVHSDTTVPGFGCKSPMVRVWKIEDACGNFTTCNQLFTWLP